MKNEDGLCQDCVYGSQPHGYFPIFCVHGKRTKELWHEVFKCKHFEKCPDFPEPEKMKPFEVIKTKEL